jgi:protein-tyrosine phosphatase
LSYDYDKFDNQVREEQIDNLLQILDFGFPDHHSPPLEMLFKIVLSMHSYLQQNEHNVAVVHCVV